MSQLVFRTITATDKSQLLNLLSHRQDESNQLHGGHGNPVMEEGVEIFDQMLQSESIKIIGGFRDEVLVTTLTMYFLPRIRSGGYVVIFEDVLVTPEERGAGVGKQLMQFAIDYCKKMPEVKKIKLGTRSSGDIIQPFYEKLGFSHQENFLQLSLH
jgi:GNAT superfamily N-acetyltransferase